MSPPFTRRAALGRIASAASLALPTAAMAVVPSERDAELLALSAEIIRRSAASDAFREARIDPYQEEFDCIVRGPYGVTEASLDDAFAFSRSCGREAAVTKLHCFDKATDDLFERLMAIPATTQPGRAAKVRALLVHVMRNDWRGPARELDYDKDMARRLLGEFAGMSPEELAEV